MTVSTTNKKLVFTGDGTDAALSITFEFYNSSELLVTQVVTATGVRTNMELDTHWSLNEGGSGEDGTIDVISGATNYTSAMTWEVERVTPLTQTASYTSTGTFSSASHEDRIDKNVLAIQECIQAIPDAEVTHSGTMALDAQSDTAHGFGFPPKMIRAFARCLSAEHGFVAGDEVEWGIGGMATGADVTAAGGIVVMADSTNLSFYVCETNNPAVRSLTTGSLVAITLASWKFFVHGWW